MDTALCVAGDNGAAMKVDIGNRRFNVKLSLRQWAAVWAVVVFGVGWVVRVEVKIEVLTFRLAQCVDQEQKLQKQIEKANARMMQGGDDHNSGQ